MAHHHQALTTLESICGLIAGLCAIPASAQNTGQGTQKAIFATNTEAEAAAKHFN